MNRNNERHFNQIPEMKASRTRFNRDQTILTTFARMCNVMEKDKSTFIGQTPADYVGYKLAVFEDETDEFRNEKEKAWEGKPNE